MKVAKAEKLYCTFGAAGVVAQDNNEAVSFSAPASPNTPNHSVNVDKTRSCTDDLNADLQVSSARNERKQLSCCVFVCRQERLFVPSCRACSAPNNPNCVSLSDLLHEVPRLWEFTPSRYWNILLAVNKEVRRQVQGMVRCIKVTEALQPEQLHHLTKGGWSQLRCLDLSKGCMTAASHAQLSKGAWPLLQNLTLASGRTFNDRSSCSEHVFRQFKGKWPLLESLTVSEHRLDVAQVTALTDIDWPLLQIFCIEPFHDAIPALMKGNWPELKHLSIGHGLDYRGLRCWSNLPWSTLQRLQLTFCQVSPNSIHSLVQAHLPQLQEFSFVYVFWKSEGEDSEDCFAMLAQAKWPLLSKLELTSMSASHEGIRHLVTGQWPKLQTVILKHFDITDEDLPLLVQADWSNVQHLILIGPFQHMEVLYMFMDKWPALQTLELGVATHQTTNALMSILARARWRSLDLQLIPEV